MAMNLIKQFNEFRRYCQNHKISANAQALYYELLGRFNDQRRCGELVLSSGTLTAVLNIDYAALEAARKQLERHGLITRAAVRSQASSRYHIIELPNVADWHQVHSDRIAAQQAPKPAQSKAKHSKDDDGGKNNYGDDNTHRDSCSGLQRLRRDRQTLRRQDVQPER